MNCSEELVAAYFDDELEAGERAGVERHVRECAACSETLARLQDLRADIRSGELYHAAPADLRSDVERTLRSRASTHVWRYVAMAATVLLAISVAWNVVILRRNTGSANIPNEVIADHVRSLLGTHLVDVPSSDQHTVKPWFAGRLDFSPTVKDLDAAGFKLIGGRADYVAGKRVAALVYQRRQHWINLFLWPAAEVGSSSFSRDGYNVVHWSGQGMSYWAVSDVSISELERFHTLYTE